MSRHSATLPNGDRLVVGWDRPLKSYFAQVFDAHHKDVLYLDVGCEPDVHLLTIEDLRKRMGNYALYLDNDLKARLCEDRL